jgi:predicted ATPase/DNA-binding NarL/FixJ family response regulator
MTMTNFSDQLIPFVGREADVKGVQMMLTDEDCRLVTIVGPGGMGKTRLAERITELAGDLFSNECCWINLHALRSTDFLLPAVVDACGLTLYDDPLGQLSQHFIGKQLLLVFDNFEHLLDGAPQLTSLLEVAPDIKILVTSRETLNLHEEWVYHLDGLPYPTAADFEHAETYPAVDLFARSARRVSSSFKLDDEKEAVARICQHVAGMPLALELAAGWTRSLTCAEIASELNTGLDLLTTRTRNLPERHSSLRLIFEQTCAMLSPEEYTVFRRLSVFTGTFDRNAAEQVAGATMSILAMLIDKSLVKHNDSGRYFLHELVRQFADEELRSTPHELEAACAKHSAYYLRLLNRCENDIMGAGQTSAIVIIKADLDNIRTAWQWALDHAEIELVQNAATALAEYCQIQSQYVEAARLFESAARAFESRELLKTLVLIQTYQAGFYIRVGRLQEAKVVLQACTENYETLGIPPVPGFATDPAFNLGILALIQGDFDNAFAYGSQMRDNSEHSHHQYNRQLAYHLLAEAALGLGNFEQAEKYALYSLKLLKEAGNRWFMAYSYNQLGTIASALGDYATAQQHFEAGYRIRAEFNDPEGMALALRHIGENRHRRRLPDEAHEALQQSLSLYDQINDRGGYAQVLVDLALLDRTTGDYDASLDQLHKALEIASEIQFVSLILTILTDLAETLLEVGDRETSAYIEQVISHQQNHVDLEMLVEQLLLNLPHVSTAVDTTAPKHIPKFKQTLIEPLTEREQEVLYYIAQGLSNRDIAGQLFISVSTVKSHINNLYGKLNASSRDEAITQAHDLDLL